MSQDSKLKYVLIIPDGAADEARASGRSPLSMARTHYSDFLAREGVSGLMQTLYNDLPKESIVAQLGMLGWDPHRYYPHGRASCELLALEGVHLNDADLAFRANLVSMEDGVLTSYNARYILSEDAHPLIRKLNRELHEEFSDFELYHNSDFRNTLVIRDADIDPRLLDCPEPHESHGVRFEIDNLIKGKDKKSSAAARRINQYLLRVSQLLGDGQANMLLPWSASKVLSLPQFSANTGFEGKVGVVGAMDFLQGIAKAGGIETFKVGNGRPDTDFRAKGRKVVKLLSSDFGFVVCHINAPDEAAHMGDLELKIKSIELIDEYIVRPVVEYFLRRPDELGGVMIVPDHYTNSRAHVNNLKRIDVHSIHPVPFALWNHQDRDEVRYFCEEDAAKGKYGQSPVSHLDLLTILGIKSTASAAAAGRKMAESVQSDDGLSALIIG
ncbi:MAG: hypothetical protein WBV94_14060 [Blastocatellia bacterium]